MSKTIILDKIGSVLKNLDLKPEVSLTDDLSCEMGSVLAAEVLEDKAIYNQFELVSGRMSVLKKGDIIAVALGSRMALKGFTGRLPRRLESGDVIHLLNFGGVAGICTSANVQEVGEPLRIRVLGGISKKKKLLNIKDAALFKPLDVMKNKTPLIIVTGTSMDSGKTTAATEIVKTLTRMGMKLGGTKLTGVGAHRDIYKMLDNGVSHAVSFTDCGITSTANIEAQKIVSVAKGALEHLSQHKPDAIIIEFGDGLMGKYGVDAILSDPQIQANVRLHIGCASDPVGAVGLARECEKLGLPLDVLSGPVTDNEVGKQIIAENVQNCLTYNAFNPSNDWLDLVIARWIGLAEGKRHVA
ncbi:MAG: hypothetical protein ACLFR0_03185 [Alphaproteobacteria bacterium]